MIRGRSQFNGVLTGSVVTLLCGVFFAWTEPGRKLELLSFDWRVRHCNAGQPTAPIVHVDIDDGALERVGRWPWHRRDLAKIVRCLSELGAGRIVVDLLLSEYERPLVDDPRYGPHSDVEPQVELLGEISEENAVFGDLELAYAISQAGNVYLAAQMEVVPPNRSGPLRQRLARWWTPEKPTDSAAVIAALGLEDGQEQRNLIRREILRLRMRYELLQDLALTDQELARRLDCDLAEAAAVVAGVKSEAANELVGRLFEGGVTPTLDSVLESVLGRNKDRNTADRQDVLAAYALARGLSAVQASSYELSPTLRGRFCRAVDVVPPHFYLGGAARGLGAVNFSPESDGGVRRVPIIVEYRDRAVPHLGLAVACDLLGLDLGRMSLSADQKLVIPTTRDQEPLRVPLDPDGNMIIHWTGTAKDWRRGLDFPHISAAKVWSLVEKGRQIEDNQTAVAYQFAEVIAAAKGEFKVTGQEGAEAVPADQMFREKVNRQLDLRRRAHLAHLRGDVAPQEIDSLERQSAALLEEIEREQRLAVSTVELTCQELDGLPSEEVAADAELRETAARFRRARDLITRDVAALQAANERLRQSAAELQAELLPRIKDKYVFVGFAATATGDIVTTPVDPRTNGVMCHAQVLNSFLQRRFMVPPRPWIGLLLSLLLGAVAAVITAFRGPYFALFAVVALLLAYTAQNAYVAFMRFDAWVPLAGVLASIGAAWAAVTLFRQLTAERERRFFAKQLGQYTSPAIAARIAESPEAAQAFKTVQTREVTCFFSDLKGFTTITEQEDAEIVQYVLNTYLERMCRVIWSNRGLINKFMGDGIMAFFNASVDPVADHQRVACGASLQAFDELERLKLEQRRHPAAAIFEKLEMRVGLASGLCKNGDLGSELKADYTVIGDVVNLAARLEPANKVFGTRIMVSGPTRDAVADLYEFRYLAELQVKGKAQTVPVYEIICRKEGLSDEQREYIRRFEAGVELYKERKWDECIVHFTRLVARKVDDLGASRYIDACQEFKVFPPADDWPGALELKEK